MTTASALRTETAPDETYDKKKYNHHGYHVYKIPKRIGLRTIEEPNPVLKKKQKEILKLLLRFRPTLGPYSHGFLKKRSIITNAERHFVIVGKEVRPCNCLLKIDLRNFFPTVTKDMVQEIISDWDFPRYIYESVLEYCFLTGRLPQGAPTSPYLANLAATPMDYRIAGLTKKWRKDTRYQPINYSRYADDLAFSSDYPRLIDIIHPIRFIVRDCGFEVNNDKVEFHRQPAQLKICGIVINKKLSVERQLWRRVRATIHGAITDVRSGMAEPGYYLAPETRRKIREMSGLKGAPGLVSVENLPPDVTFLLETTPRLPIPWNQWQGIISHIESVDKYRGGQLRAQFEELRRIPNGDHRRPATRE